MKLIITLAISTLFVSCTNTPTIRVNLVATPATISFDYRQSAMLLPPTLEESMEANKVIHAR